MKRRKIEKYKIELAEHLTRSYAKLGNDDAEQKKALKDKLWLLFSLSNKATRAKPNISTTTSGIGRTMVFAYIRANTKGEITDQQLQTIADYANIKSIKIDRVIEEKTYWGEVFQGLKPLLRRGDTVIVKELERLGQDMIQIRDEWHELYEKGVNLIVTDDEAFSTANKTENIKSIVKELLTYMAASEKNTERSQYDKEIAEAKARKYKEPGKPRIKLENFEDLYRRWKNKEIKVHEIMQEFNISSNTFYTRAKEYEQLMRKKRFY